MTTLLELAGIACLTAFAFLAWPPSALLVIGVALILISRGMERRS